jgi:hypothetical protein
VELLQEVWRVFQMFGRLPRVVGIGVSLPPNLILQAAAEDAGVKDLFNFPFASIVDNDRRRRRLNAVRQGVFAARFEQGDMENRVDLHGFG